MNYSVGALKIQSNISLPSCYDVFACEENQTAGSTQNGAQEESFGLFLDSAFDKPNLARAVQKSKHDLMIVWEQNDGWIFESIKHDGFLTVSRDYSHGLFFCDEEERSEKRTVTDVLQPLLQAMVQCCMVYNGIAVLHSACVANEGRAIAFSAPSGTGKSKRASQWVQTLGAAWISGDRPAICPAKGMAYGVPWDGKDQIFVNTAAPLQAIVEVRRSGKTYARKMTNKQKTDFLASQLFIPMWDVVLAQKAFLGMKRMIDNIPIYRLYCDISPDSVRKTYDIIFRQTEEIQEEKEEKKMKLKKGFEIIDIAGDYMAIATGENMAEFGGSVVLNEVSAFLLKAMKKSVTEEELLGLLTNEYDVEEATAAADLKAILDTFRQIGLIEE